MDESKVPITRYRKSAVSGLFGILPEDIGNQCP
jgi:hypothetical protein